MIQLERSVAHHHFIDDHPANVGHHHRGHHYVEASCYHLWVWVCLIPADIVAPVQLHHLADDGWKGERPLMPQATSPSSSSSLSKMQNSERLYLNLIDIHVTHTNKLGQIG